MIVIARQMMFSLVFAGTMVSALQGADRPNLVFILADDLGWSDTTLFGTTKFYETPNIERLARRGLLFTNAYTRSARPRGRAS
jgi:arylsulfatase A-like enzyme